jgi:hypothetical protein
LRSGGESGREEIARAILSYLLRHPAAADTFEGIVRWRILEEIAKSTAASTEEAMRWLIARGLVCEQKITRGRVIYKLDPARRNEAELLVKKREAPPRKRLQRSG